MPLNILDPCSDFCSLSGKVLTYYEDEGLKANAIDKDRPQERSWKWEWKADGKLYNLKYQRDIDSLGRDHRSGEYHPGAGDIASKFEPSETERNRKDFAEDWLSERF